jgi:hypothetical protein
VIGSNSARAAKAFLPAAFNAKAERAERFAASIAAGASTSQGGMDKGVRQADWNPIDNWVVVYPYGYGERL